MTCLLLSLGAGALGCQALVDLDYGFAPADAGASRSGGTGGSGGSGAVTVPPVDPPDGDVTDLPPPSGGADCGQGNAAACAPPPVVLHGSVVHFDTGEPFAGVRIGIGPGSVSSSATGEFEYTVAAPDSILDLTLTQPETDGIPAFLRTQLRIDEPRAASQHSLHLPSVLHEWLVQVAVSCQVIAADAPASEVDDYFNRRSTLLAEVPNTPNITRDQITVTMTRGTGEPWVNSHESPLDTTSPPKAHVCFLEPDGLGNLVGSTRIASTELGQFVMFRVRNADGGGTGLAEVNVTGHGSASVNFSGAGETGVVRLGAGWEQ